MKTIAVLVDGVLIQAQQDLLLRLTDGTGWRISSIRATRAAAAHPSRLPNFLGLTPARNRPSLIDPDPSDRAETAQLAIRFDDASTTAEKFPLGLITLRSPPRVWRSGDRLQLAVVHTGPNGTETTQMTELVVERFDTLESLRLKWFAHQARITLAWLADRWTLPVPTSASRTVNLPEAGAKPHLHDPLDSLSTRASRSCYQAMRLLGTACLSAWHQRARRRLERDGRAPILILTYHGIGNGGENWLTLPLEAFHEQITIIRDHFPVLDMEEALRRLRSSNHETAVVLTFDDGYASCYDNLLPYLDLVNVPATLFICAEAADRGLRLPHDVQRGFDAPLMTTAQLRSIASRFEIGSHGSVHEDLSRLHGRNLAEAITNSADSAHEVLQRPVRYLAFPFGTRQQSTPEILDVARMRYDAVFSSYGGYNLPGPGSQFHFHRIPAPSSTGSLVSVLCGMHRMRPYAAT